ncbi:hypothetical protein CMUS01_14617 [Colletotrichum musicola]|uniref:Uncharacterized protein n=1 Tax=Colletotrichum musicola TaxID=2175873 RepID=A0A8H6J3H4_9PEZI|nr:hypothetical protein CMUS01_14617 [Colletotrichum musicola]
MGKFCPPLGASTCLIRSSVVGIPLRFASLDRAPFALDLHLDLALRPVTVQRPQHELKSVHVTYTSQRPCAPVKATALDLGHSCAPPAEQARRRHWTAQPKIRSRRWCGADPDPVRPSACATAPVDCGREERAFPDAGRVTTLAFPYGALFPDKDAQSPPMGNAATMDRMRPPSRHQSRQRRRQTCLGFKANEARPSLIDVHVAASAPVESGVDGDGELRRFKSRSSTLSHSYGLNLLLSLCPSLSGSHRQQDQAILGSPSYYAMYSPAGVVPLTIRHLSRLPESNHGTRSPTLHPRFADVHAPNRPASVRRQLLHLLHLHCTSRSKSRAWALLLPHQHDAARRHSSDHTAVLHGTTRPFSLAAEAAQDTVASSSWVRDNARENPQPAVHNGGRIDEQDGGGQAGKPGTGRNLQAVLHARTEVVPDLRFVIYRPSDKVTSAFGSTTQTDHPLREIGLDPGSQKGLLPPNAHDASRDTRLGSCGCWTGVRGQSLSRTNQEQEEDIINGKEEDSTQT